MTNAGQALARSLGQDVLEQDANVLLHASGFQVEETEETELEIDSQTLLTILKMRKAAIENGIEHGKVKRSTVIFAATSFYSVIETRELVTVYETWESAFRRAQRTQDQLTIAELDSMIQEAQLLVDAESALDSVAEEYQDLREPITEEELDSIRTMFATTSRA